jgi:hypothetical protein
VIIMMLKFFLIKNKPEQEKGIALIFALAILSLLFIMALSFATNSIFEEKAAFNSANTSSARLLAISTLNRVRTAIQNYDQGIASLADQIKIYHSHASTASNDLISSLLPVTDLYSPGTVNYINWSNSGNVYWNYVKVADDQGNSRILGRTTFVILPNLGLDPGKLVKKTVNEGKDPAEEERIGVEANEINIRSIDTSIFPATNLARATKFSWTAIGLFTGSWISFPNLFKKFKDAGDAFDSPANTKELMQIYFALNTPDSKEAYWVDKDSDNKLDFNEDDIAATTNELYTRFNLARTDWDAGFATAGNVYDKILLDTDGNGTPEAMPDQWADADSNGKGIPWLAFWGYKTDGTEDASLLKAGGGPCTFGTITAWRRQIAANLVDYCDSNSIPTSDVDSTTWVSSATQPTFTGNEKTPYINEIGIKVQAEAVFVEDPNPPKKFEANVAFEIIPAVELINIYSDPWAGGTVKVFISGVVSARVVIGTKHDQVHNLSFSETISVTDWNANKYSRLTLGVIGSSDVQPATGVTLQDTDSKTVNVTINSIIINKVVLLDSTGNQGYDYVKTLTTSPAKLLLSGIVDTSLDKDEIAWFGCSVEDPRQNLNSGDWTFASPVITTDPSTSVLTVTPDGAGGYWGGNNISATPVVAGANVDEALTDPANGNISTAYIRNAPMISPWEIGFIQRGIKWQTLNIKEYDKNKATKYISGTPALIPGGGKYSDTTNGGGDANILDQIKMNNKPSNYKINVCTKYRNALTALFSNIYVDASKVTPGSHNSPATILSSTDVGNLQSAVYSRSTTGVTSYVTRAQVVNDLSVATPISGYTTDAKKEEIIGKIVNITRAGAQFEYFTAIILAQAIKDVGGKTGSGKPVKIVKLDSSGSPLPAKDCYLGTFDYDSSKNVYYDEIVAQQKILALMRRNTDGSCDVLSLEYITP